jgi:2-phospho-L-lactate/phosphoenolpyruvate guanylyltransferase
MERTYTPAAVHPTDGHVAVLVPVKAFAHAKARLAAVLDEPARASLAREMAARVLAAAGALPVTVACDDEEVAAWAEAHGAAVAWTPGMGLNGAVTAGVDALAAQGASRVVVAHADLPHAVDQGPVALGEGVVAVPDRREDGTNVLAVPTAAGFRFAYGPGSFARHEAEAERIGAPFTVLRLPDLTWDVDVPADLERHP